MSSPEPIGKPEVTLQYIVIFFVFIGFFVTLYVLFEENISNGLLYLARLNITFIDFLMNIPKFGQGITQIFQPNMTPEILAKYQKWVYMTHGYEVLRIEQLGLIKFIGETIRPPVFLIIVLQVVRHIRFQRVRAFKTSYSIQTLAHESKKHLPHLIPPLSLDLLKIPYYTGQLAIGQSPLRYCIQNKLIKVYALNLKDEIDTSKVFTPTLSKTKGMMPGYLYLKDKLDDDEGLRSIFKRCIFVSDEKLRKHFTKQLGKPLTSVYNMSKPRRFLLAMTMLMAQGNSKRGAEKSYDLNRKINNSFRLKKRLNKKTFKPFVALLNTDRIIRQYIEQPQFQRLVDKHAYELTFLTGAIETARKYGKFFTSHNYWIKYFERDLWFSFHQTESPTCWVETSAVRGHYLWEEKTEISLEEAQVDTTILGLKTFMTITENWIYQKEYLS